MATLRFSFGTMGSGKSTLALQIHHNLSMRGLHGLLCTHLDREGAQVTSRLGVAVEAVDVGPKLDLFELARQQHDHHGVLHYLVCDEAQFYAPEQADQLARVVDELGADVHALGLLTDFRGRLFPATARLLEVADERCELQVEARCWCGARATHNARLVDGEQVYEGETVVIGDVEALGDIAPAEVSYELLCRRHWLAGETGRLDHATERALSAR
jgi:thymidine kinase